MKTRKQALGERIQQLKIQSEEVTIPNFVKYSYLCGKDWSALETAEKSLILKASKEKLVQFRFKIMT